MYMILKELKRLDSSREIGQSECRVHSDKIVDFVCLRN